MKLAMALNFNAKMGHHSKAVCVGGYGRRWFTMAELAKPNRAGLGLISGTSGVMWRAGFQTHTTPVLLSTGDRAELASDEFLPETKILEGFVIVTKNPDSQKPEDQKKALKDKRKARRKANAAAETGADESKN